MKKLNTLLIASAAIVLMSCGQSQDNTQQVVEENPKVTVTTVNAEYVSQITVYPTTIEADIVNGLVYGELSQSEILAEVFHSEEDFSIFSSVFHHLRPPMRSILSFTISGISTFGASGCRSQVAA